VNDMPTNMPIDTMTGKQLKEFIERAQALQIERRAARLQELREKWQEDADQEGFTVLEVLGMAQEEARPKAKPKYRLPNGETWSGKGKIPMVLRDALDGVEGWNTRKGVFADKEARQKALETYLIT
jgi:DNA-binding protein H-NS